MKASTIIIFALAIVYSIDIRQAAPDTVAAQISEMVVPVNESITEIAKYYKKKSTAANAELNKLQSEKSQAITSMVNSGLKNVKKYRGNDQVHFDKCIRDLEGMAKKMLPSLEGLFENARHVIGEQDPLESTIKAGNNLVKLLDSRNPLNSTKHGNRKPSEVIKNLKSKVEKFRETVDSKKLAIDKECSDAISNVSEQADAFLKSLKTFASSVVIDMASCHLLLSDLNAKIRQAAPDTVAGRIDKMLSDVEKGIIEIEKYYEKKSTVANAELEKLQSENSQAIILAVNSTLRNVKEFRGNDRVHFDKYIKALKEMKKNMLLRLEELFENARHVIGEQDPLETTIATGNNLVKLLYSHDPLNPSKNSKRKPSEIIEHLESKVKKFLKIVNDKEAAIDKACSVTISNAPKQADAVLKSLKTSALSVEVEVAILYLEPSGLNRKVNDAHNFQG